MQNKNQPDGALHGDFHYQYSCFITFALMLMFLLGCVLVSFLLAHVTLSGFAGKVMRITSPLLLIMLLLSLPVKFMVRRSELTLKDGVLSGRRQSLFPILCTHFAIPVTEIRRVSFDVQSLIVETDQETFQFQFLRNSAQIGEKLNRQFLPYEQARLERWLSIPKDPPQNMPQERPQHTTQEPAFMLPQAPSEALPYVEIPLPQQDDFGALLSQQNPQDQAPGTFFGLQDPAAWGQPEQNKPEQENHNGTTNL